MNIPLRRALACTITPFAAALLAFTPNARAAVASTPTAPVIAKTTVNDPVTVTDDGRYWTLANGIVSVKINKRNGDLEALIYQGIDVAGHDQGRVACWEEDPSLAPDLKQSLTIDPAQNGGARAEVSIAGKTGGTVMLTPTAPGGGTYCDIEIRYALGRGESGVYTYAIFSHPAAYGAMGVGESRYIMRVNQDFNWLSVDADRNMLACGPRDWGTGVVIHAKEQRLMSQGPYKNSVEHKYSYNAIQYKIPAYGWSDTKDHIGVWFINPTIEYLSGGASKQELVCHFGDNDNPDPIILDYWRGTHYAGGASCNINAGEEWSKVVGPIFIYVNSLASFKTPSQAELDTLAATAGNPTVPAAWKDNQTALWQNALAQAKVETANWPYDWVTGVDYPHKNERGTVTGQLVLNDPLAPAPMKAFTHVTVGLAHPDYGRVTWVNDAKFYEFWNDGSADGKFTLTNVRPGNYTLHAFADGVLGEFAQADITVKAGQSTDLGKLDWKPIRYGKQVWDIGYPDRTGGKFFKGDGDNYWLWGWGLRYPLLFPNDITYTIGKSDYHKDWFFQQTPHSESTAWINPEAKDPANQRFGWIKAESLEQYPQTDTTGPWRIYGRGRATTWTIKFNLDKAPQGYAALRVALAGADGTGRLAVTVNGQEAGAVGGGGNVANNPILATNALRYNTDKSVWQERTLTFDASMLKKGENELTLTVPAGELTTGVVYDYLRLELNEDYKIDGTPLTHPVAANN